MILKMIAFQDPNYVPLQAFYNTHVKVNFCGRLAVDPKPQASSISNHLRESSHNQDNLRCTGPPGVCEHDRRLAADIA